MSLMTEPISASSLGEEKTSTVQAQPQSYAAVVNKRPPVRNRPTLFKHDLNVTIVDGDSIVQVPDEIFEDAAPLWDDLIIGRFPSTAPHVAKVHVIVNKIWSLGDKSIKIDAFAASENTIKFRIRDSSVRAMVLRRGMWNIVDRLMIVSKWSPVIEDSQPELQVLPMWVTVKNIPNSMFTWKGISFLTSALGEPKRLHPDTELCKSFEEAKVFVEVDLSKDLPKCFRFKSDKGIDAVVEYTYPWLPRRCLTCSKWGHLQDGCLSKEKPNQVQVVQVQEAQNKLNDESQSTLQINETQSQETVMEVDQQTLIGNEVVISDSSNSTKEEVWHSVSPTRAGKQRDQSLVEQTSYASPSRFSPLVVEEEEPSREEGEFDISAADLVGADNATELLTEQENSKNMEVLDMQTTRPSLPRASKNQHKVLSDPGTQNTKVNPSGTSKRDSKKKT